MDVLHVLDVGSGRAPEWGVLFLPVSLSQADVGAHVRAIEEWIAVQAADDPSTYPARLAVYLDIDGAITNGTQEDRVQVARASRPRQRESHEGPAPGSMDPKSMPFDVKRMAYGGAPNAFPHA